MTKLQAILREVRSLSDSERAELLALLAKELAADAGSEHDALGRRGLAAWSELSRDEDWSEFYPDSLRSGNPSTH